MGKNNPLMDGIERIRQQFANLDAEYEERKGELLAQVKALRRYVCEGDSSDDLIMDYILRELGVISEKAAKPLRELEAKLKKGQLFLVRQQIAETRSDYYTNWYVGVLSGETLVFSDGRFGIPTEKYFAHGPGMRKMIPAKGPFKFPNAKRTHSILGSFGCTRTKPEFEVTVGDLEVLALALDVLGNAALFQMAKALREGVRG